MYRFIIATALIAQLHWGHPAAAAESTAGTVLPSQPQSPAAPADRSGAERRRRPEPGGQGVYKMNIVPHWYQDDARFWYRNDLTGGTKEFVLVDTDKGVRKLAFDHQRVADALSKAAGKDFKANQLPFSEIELQDNDRLLKFQAADKTWECDLTSYKCTVVTNQSALNVHPGLPSIETAALTAAARPAPEPDAPAAQETRISSRPNGSHQEEVKSPNGKWIAFTQDNNVYIRSENDGQETTLTTDGVSSNAYARLAWAPDSQALVTWRIEPGDQKEVYLIRSSPPGGGRATFSARPYALAGDKFNTYELSVLDVAARKQIKPQVDRFEHEWEAPRIRWNRDGRHFTYEKEDRGHQRLRLIEVDSLTGSLRNLIDEKTDTFLWTAHTENLNVPYITWLEKTDEIVYVSEKDGWRHLYLVDAREGTIKNRITQGEYVVRGIDRIDEDTRQIWFRASGRNPDESPYNIHYYRVNFDGGGLVVLTEGKGNHTVQYSPTRKYLIDTRSWIDAPPVHTLRCVAGPSTLCELERADIAELRASGWNAPEPFVAKGRDGKTDIYGIICRPPNFDPEKKYPVIEQIYAGPQSSYLPKSFSSARRFASLTDLGFIVVQIDGMGTADRSKAFHDVCWKNLKDAGFPDRILWHKAVAAKYPYYDISRVGIYGTSAGGQNAAGALLFHPEFYKAAVANSGCHDNRMDKASWNEQWMGYPVGPQYVECSNIENAAKLQGNLMLVVGEVDDNVPPETTFRFVDALIRANKDFDLLVVPNGGHGAGGAYGQRRLQDFFVRHLQRMEPPNRNAIAPEK